MTTRAQSRLYRDLRLRSVSWGAPPDAPGPDAPSAKDPLGDVVVYAVLATVGVVPVLLAAFGAEDWGVQPTLGMVLTTFGAWGLVHRRRDGSRRR